MNTTKKFGTLGNCVGLPVVRASKMYKKIKDHGYTLTVPNNTDNILRGSAVCVPITYYGGVYFHWGISLGNGKIIDYSGKPVIVVVNDVNNFSYGEPKNIRVGLKPNNSKHAENIIKRIESRLGEGNYNLFTNNCEVLVMWSYYGVEYSHQVTSWLGYLVRRITSNKLMG